MVSSLSITSLKRVYCRPGFWFLVALFLAISVPHYDETLHQPFINRIFEYIDMDRYAFERILYIVPITLAGFIFGHRGAYYLTWLRPVL
ncbi:MAG: hypothetical protein JSW38_00005 [Dehalococcoidia bacterium]|nr:MAG: hypothetical protein JSW38_00005 [Dehalococcoidia bacterium]